MNRFSLLWTKHIVQMFLHGMSFYSDVLFQIVLLHIDQDLFICVIILGREHLEIL